MQIKLPTGVLGRDSALTGGKVAGNPAVPHNSALVTYRPKGETLLVGARRAIRRLGVDSEWQLGLLVQCGNVALAAGRTS
jgi:hypothetical protein